MNVYLDTSTASSATLYSGYEMGQLSAAGLAVGSGPAALDNLDSINWLINSYNGSNYTWGEVQAAIWSLIGDDWTVFAGPLGNPDPARVASLTGQALAHDGFVPDAGQILGLVMDVRDAGGSQQQPTLIEVRAAKLGDRVFADSNANGVQDSGESGIAGATVELVRDVNGDGDFNDANELLASTTTDASGDYSFKGLTPGVDYQVRFTQPTGYDGASPRQAGGNTAIDSDGPVSDVQKLAPGEYRSTIDSGFYKFASLGDRVWIDANANGQQDFGEAGQSGVTVKLLNSAGTVISTQTSGAGGSYLFTNLVPGTYAVEFVQPTGYGFTSADTGADVTDSDVNPGTGRTGSYTLTSGEVNRSVDAGLVQKAQPLGTISGKVLEDLDNNDSGDAPIAGVVVVLKDSAGTVIGTQTTAADGSYSFTNLPAGTYTVEETNKAGFTDVTDIDGGNPNSISVTLGAGGNSPGNDFVDEKPVVVDPRNAALGDRVWIDANGNGQQDFGEASLSGVTVKLLDSTGSVIATQTTSAGGNYLFSNLAAGTYSVQFVARNGYTLTNQNVGSDTGDSDANPSTGLTGTYTLGAGETNRTVDAGVVANAPPPGSLSGTVLEDRDNNGTGDTPIAGVTVVLKNPAGAVVGQTTTATDGTYSFTNLTPGNYTVEQTNLPGYNDVGDKDGGDPNSITAVVPAGGASTGNDFVDERPAKAQLGDRVWLDANSNGQQDAGEAGVAGVTVNLLNASGQTVGTQQTTGTGNYLFTGLDAGTYSVEFVKPTGYNFTAADTGADGSDSDANTSSGRSGSYTLAAGDSNLTVDAGLVVPVVAKATLGDRVFLDRNGNGLQDTGEAGIAGVTVTLTDASGNPLATTTTDANGNYSFQVAPGTYAVRVTTPTGYTVTGKDTGTNDTIDSDINSTGTSGTYTLTPGQSNLTVDAGLYKAAALGDRVWLDANKNGQQDSGETGVGGVTVNLLTSTGAVVATQTTDGSGNYLFTGLKPGTYKVQFVKPADYDLTVANTGLDASDSDAAVATGTTGNYTLVSGQTNRTVDAGLVAKPAPVGSLSGRVLEDTNNDNVGDTPIAGVPVLLKNSAGTTVATTSTDSNGNYNFTNLPAGTYTVHELTPSGFTDVGDKDGGDPNSITAVVPAGGASTGNDFVDERPAKAQLGDRVWLDANKNGVQDTGEAGLAGVQVQLLDSSGSQVATRQTDGSGNYLFDNLNAGTYSVRFVAPTGYSFTERDAFGNGADGIDSDANTATGLTGSYTLNAGGDLRTVDAGLFKLPVNTASIGDRVWLDANGNGLQDSNEAGVSGVTVQLRDATDAVLRTTTTDGSGNYLFDNLGQGNYKVHVVKPADFTFTTQDALGNGADGVDSDVNALGSTATIALGEGQAIRTVDAGLVAVRTASIGNTVWEDLNFNGVQDAGERGVAGVTVKLLDGAGATLSTTTTDANGSYLFDKLAEGDYKVQVVNPNGYFVTKQDQGGNDATDSDIDRSTGTTGLINLSAGEQDTSVDAGLYRKAAIGDYLWFDGAKNTAGELGDSIQGTNPWEAPFGYGGYFTPWGQGGIQAVSVSLYDASGTLVQTNPVGADGRYLFDNLDPGTYKVTFQFTPTLTVWSTTWNFVDPNRGGDDTRDSDAVVPTGKRYEAEVTGIQLDSGERDMSIDAGFWYSPIAIDLNGDGVRSIGLERGVAFDMLNSGSKVHTGWLSGHDGFLAVDSNGNGQIDNRAELFGGSKGDGFAKLASYDSNADGVVDAKDAQFNDLRIWQDANENGVTDAGELISLAQAGLAALNVTYTDVFAMDANGNVHGEHSSATFADGRNAAMVDLYFAIGDEAQFSAPKLQDLLGDDRSLDGLLGSVQAGAAPAAANDAAQAMAFDSGAGELLRQMHHMMMRQEGVAEMAA